jgi:hypothetical protein
VKYLGFGCETIVIQKRWVRPPMPTVCRVCGNKPVLRFVGTAGYCGAHIEQAFAAARARMEVGDVRTASSGRGEADDIEPAE